MTFGWGVADEETYLERLKTGIESTLKTGRVEVLNYGVPGYNSVQEAALVRARVLPGNPDLLILGYVLNDAEPTLFDEQAGRRSLLDSSQLFQLARDLLTDFDTPSGRSRRAASQALGQIGARPGSRGSGPVLRLPQRRARREPEQPRRIARDSGFTVVDLYSAFEAEYRKTGTSLRDLTLSATDAHPNPAGHDLIARTLLPHVLGVPRPCGEASAELEAEQAQPRSGRRRGHQPLARGVARAGRQRRQVRRPHLDELDTAQLDRNTTRAS